MTIKLNEILDHLDQIGVKYKFEGNENLTVNRYASNSNIGDNCVSWVKNQINYKEGILSGLKDVLLITEPSLVICEDIKGNGLIMCENSKEAFFSIINAFFPQDIYNSFISPNSVVETTTIGKDIYIGHNCYIGKNVTIDDNVVIKHNVTIEGTVKIGKNTIIHSGVVIGSHGFGYYQNSEGKNIKVPQFGGVIIGQDVEIGANTCIDKGTIDNTVIGNNVKIDKLCVIGHNSVLKDNSSMVATSVLLGSVTLEENSYIAPAALIKNQLHIGKNSLVGMGAVVIEDVDDNNVVAGVPAKVIRKIINK